MFDNIAFNVAIGLVMIYLLYSLLVTIVGELLTAWMGIRQRMLRRAIARMLNDGASRQKWLSRFLLQESAGFDRTLAGKFYAYPTIKYLGKLEASEKKMFGNTKPAYISAETFGVTLISLLADKGAGESKWDKVTFCLKFNILDIEPETLKHLENIVSVSGADINILRENFSRWFDETMDRANGWYKNKIRMISFSLGFIIALSFNVDTIFIARILANDKEARNQLVTMGVELARDSARFGTFVHKERDSVLSQEVLDSGFARVTRDIDHANMILGLGWTAQMSGKRKEVIIYNSNRSYADIALLAPRLTTAESQMDTHRDHLASDRIRIDSVNKNLNLLMIDSSLSSGEKDTVCDCLVKTRQALADDNLRIKKDSLLLSKAQHTIQKLVQQIDSLADVPFTRIDSIRHHPRYGQVIYGQVQRSPVEKFFYILWMAIHPGPLVGFLITALALSLGAPFWFDLLKKLVSIRTAGVKPEEKKVPPAAEKMDSIKEVPAPPQAPMISDAAESALQMFGANIRNIPGVQSVFAVMDKTTGSRFVQCNVDNADTRQVVQQKFPNLSVNGVQVVLKVVASGIARQRAGDIGKILNASRRNGFGSLGCIVENGTTRQRHLLSCWHVLKGDTQYDERDDSLVKIIDMGGHALGRRWTGGIKDALDFGLAELFPQRAGDNNSDLFNNLGISGACTHRPVTIDDITGQIPVKYFDVHSGKKHDGFIYTHVPSHPITYKDKVREMKDLLILTKDVSGGAAISIGGNSGAIVFDDAGSAIAMIIAGDKNHTYAIRLSNVFAVHDELTILNQQP